MQKKWRLIGIASVTAIMVGYAATTLWITKSPQEADGMAAARQMSGEISATNAPTQSAEGILSKMSDEEKIGQLMIVGIPGSDVDQTALDLIGRYHMGGIALFDRNMENPAQVQALTAHLQKEARQGASRLPLFICVDQEGGQVVRMSQSAVIAPSEEALASTGDPQQATLWAQRVGEDLKKMGINVNFAPVVDLGATYERSYGKDPTLVTEFARAAAQGYQQAGVLFALKHFPGIGRTKVDPHVDPYVIEASQEALENQDVVPFAALIRELDNESFFVMVSHLTYPAYDGERAASVSRTLMKEVLREKMGFQGLIITDDMEMGALAKVYSFEQMGYLAINAGADMVLVCHDPQHEIAVYNGMLAALQDGRLDRDAVDDAVRRIIEVKLRYLDRGGNIVPAREKK